MHINEIPTSIYDINPENGL